MDDMTSYYLTIWLDVVILIKEKTAVKKLKKGRSNL